MAGLEDQAPMVMFEVTKAAVDEARGDRAGPGTEVGFIDQRRRKPAFGGVASYARAGDPTADDEYID